jgi:hypothetical protein
MNKPAINQNNPIIEDVDVVFKTSLKNEYLKYLVGFAIAYLLWAVFLMKYLPRYLGPQAEGDAVGFGLSIPLVVVALLLRNIRNKILAKFYLQFAAANNYIYTPKAPDMVGEGALFTVGRSKQCTNLVKGRFQNHPIVIFNYNYTLQQGRHAQTWYYTVFEIDYDRVLPKMFMRADRGLFDAMDNPMIKPDFNNGRKLKLEGDFDKHFDLFVEEKFEIEALQVFTPDIMHKLMTDWRKLNLEFVSDKIYIYAAGRLSKKPDLQSMYDLAKYLIEKLPPVLKRIEGSVIEMQARVK